jgi:hypothetical protein
MAQKVRYYHVNIISKKVIYDSYHIISPIFDSTDFHNYNVQIEQTKKEFFTNNNQAVCTFLNTFLW